MKAVKIDRFIASPFSLLFFREEQGGNSGEGKDTINPSPKIVLDPPPLMIRFPPLCSRPVILLIGNGHRPDESHFLRPPKLALEEALYGMFFGD